MLAAGYFEQTLSMPAGGLCHDWILSSRCLLMMVMLGDSLVRRLSSASRKYQLMPVMLAGSSARQCASQC